MANSLPSKAPATPAEPIGKCAPSRIRHLLFLALGLFLAVCVAASWMTRDAMSHLPFLQGPAKTRPIAGGDKTIIDLGPWQTIEALEPLAVTAEEMRHAQEAERLADHEVDQAFATGLREGAGPRHALAGEALSLSRRVAQLQEIVQQDQAKVHSLTPGSGSSPSSDGVQAVSPEDDLEVAKAQLGLDSDELADAQRDLARAAGDRRGEIREELAAHEAEMSKTKAVHEGEVAIVSAQQYGTLAGRLKAWFGQRSRHQLIQQAMLQAQSDAAALTVQHDALEAQADDPSEVRRGQSGDNTDRPNRSADLNTDTAARLARIKLGSEQRQLLSIYDDRIQSEQQLASVYGKWSDQVLLQHRILLHLIVRQLALIALILLCLAAGDDLVNRVMERLALERRRAHTLRTMIKLGLQLLSVLLILFIVFGVPRQMPTILGLTTAGFTVVLQDFIIAFFGWFVLMGAKGIRVGDAVEINGVAGEVIDISLLRTTVHETGNWTDKGHPTGRRVIFLNNYAITGQYFNFSTTGQWMWDEISVNVPASDNTYATIETIHKAILKETESDARLAEEEWKRISKQVKSQFSAKPEVNLRPAASGIDILVRYVTRASQRFVMRNRLFQCVVDVLHQPPANQHQLEFSCALSERDSAPVSR